jgi:tripartite-type tricarboxylate transporter receptor subunit TctC
MSLMSGKACTRLIAVACALVLGAPAAFAQGFPTRPVKVIVPFAPGGPVDVLARALRGVP